MAKKFVLYDDTVGVDKARNDNFPLCKTCADEAGVEGWMVLATLEEYFTCLLLEHRFWVPLQERIGWHGGNQRWASPSKARWHWPEGAK